MTEPGIGKYNKAFTALVNTAVYLGAAFGLDLAFLQDPAVMGTVLPILNTLLVWLVPNAR